MTIDTSKETGYVVQSSVASDELIVTKETGYVVLKPVVNLGTEIRIKGGIILVSGQIIIR